MTIPFSVYDFFGYLASGFFVLVAFDLSFGQGWFKDAEPKLVPAVALVFAAYIIGHAVAHLAWWLIEELFVREVLHPPEETLLKPDFKSSWKRVFPGFFKALPPETRDAVLQKARSAGIEQPGRGLFYHCHPIAMQVPAAKDRLDVFLNLYGFARNVCFAGFLSAVLLLAGSFRDMFATPRVIHYDTMKWAGLAIIVSIVMLYRYLKFFRHYTGEVFRTYAVADLRVGGK